MPSGAITRVFRERHGVTTFGFTSVPPPLAARLTRRDVLEAHGQAGQKPVGPPPLIDHSRLLLVDQFQHGPPSLQNYQAAFRGFPGLNGVAAQEVLRIRSGPPGDSER